LLLCKSMPQYFMSPSMDKVGSHLYFTHSGSRRREGG
jgi:hypothetical protein